MDVHMIGVRRYYAPVLLINVGFDLSVTSTMVSLSSLYAKHTSRPTYAVCGPL
jgi:hypothetical protein